MCSCLNSGYTPTHLSSGGDLLGVSKPGFFSIGSSHSSECTRATPHGRSGDGREHVAKCAKWPCFPPSARSEKAALAPCPRLVGWATGLLLLGPSK